MSEELRLAGYREPLGLWLHREPSPPDLPTLRVYELEFSSRGDRVTGRLLLPDTRGDTCPLVLLQDDLPARGEARLAGAKPWARRGAAVASVDLPLHGTRADRKLLAHLPDPSARKPAASAVSLAVERARQAVIDLERCLDALGTLESIDDGRIAYLGLGMGALVGAAFCGLDPRPRAAALSLGAETLGPASVDPLPYVGRIAPRPLLLIEAESAPRSSRAGAEALFAAAGSPKERIRLEASSDARDGAVREAAWPFLARQLGVAESRS